MQGKCRNRPGGMTGKSHVVDLLILVGKSHSPGKRGEAGHAECFVYMKWIVLGNEGLGPFFHDGACGSTSTSTSSASTSSASASSAFFYLLHDEDKV